MVVYIIFFQNFYQKLTSCCV